MPRRSEPTPQWVRPVPDGPDDPIGESVLEPTAPWYRVFEPDGVCLVLGCYQRADRELRLAAARDDAVPVYRRVTGGGAVVLAPGCLVIAVRLPPGPPGAAAVFSRVNGALVPAVAACAGTAPLTRGCGDLAMPGRGAPRKVLGASLRQTRAGDYYLGSLLVADLRPLMARYLAEPDRRPAYRGRRDHGDFCGHLDAWGVDMRVLRSRISEYLESELTDRGLLGRIAGG